MWDGDVLAEVGAGRKLVGEEVAVAGAAGGLLGDSAVAARVRAEIAEMPEPGAVVERLTGLV